MAVKTWPMKGERVARMERTDMEMFFGVKIGLGQWREKGKMTG